MKQFLVMAFVGDDTLFIIGVCECIYIHHVFTYV